MDQAPFGSVSQQLDDMLSTPFSPHIINYEPSRGFIVPKFMTYNGTSDPFNHIMHFRQLMTLDIGNDALLCKVFPTSLYGQALSWFHRFPKNSVNNFQDILEAFVGHYLCSACYKQNINTLQNIKMQENESFRDFMKRFKQVYSKWSPAAWTPFYRSSSETSIRARHSLSLLLKNCLQQWTIYSNQQTSTPCSKMTYGWLLNWSWSPVIRVDMTRQKTLSPQANRGKLTRGRMASSSRIKLAQLASMSHMRNTSR